MKKLFADGSEEIFSVKWNELWCLLLS